jgi:hypothetical protein
MTTLPRPFSFPPDPSGPKSDSILRKSEELRALLVGKDPLELAWRTGSVFTGINSAAQAGTAPHPHLETGWFELEVWSRPVRVSFPTYQAYDSATQQTISPFTAALLLYYFTTADGTPPTGRWVAFSDLPDGRFYNQAFQGYTGAELARHFKTDLTAFLGQAEKAGGIPQPGAPGDAAFYFQALPRISLMVVCWQGDEDFPSNFQVLFDASAPHYLPTDGYAILGSNLTGRIIGKKHP